jgi:hypothetical protein
MLSRLSIHHGQRTNWASLISTTLYAVVSLVWWFPRFVLHFHRHLGFLFFDGPEFDSATTPSFFLLYALSTHTIVFVMISLCSSYKTL